MILSKRNADRSCLTDCLKNDVGADNYPPLQKRNAEGGVPCSRSFVVLQVLTGGETPNRSRDPLSASLTSPNRSDDPLSAMLTSPYTVGSNPVLQGVTAPTS